MKKFLIIITLCLMGYVQTEAQIIHEPDSDTILVITGDTISDYYGNYMGRFGADGTMYNVYNEVLGKISGDHFYDLSMAEIATYDEQSGELKDYNEQLIATVQDHLIYDPQNTLMFTLLESDTIRSLGILFFFLK